jgi:hypothetical protein
MVKKLTSTSKIDTHTDSFVQAAEGRRSSFLSEFWQFARHNKKWWITPIIVILLLVGFLVLGSTGAGPLIYTLF